MKSSNSLGKNATILSISKAITLTISMIVTMLLSRYRTLEEYGTFSQIFIVINITTTLFVFGLPNSIIFFLGSLDLEEERNKFLSFYYTLSTILGIFIGIVLLASSPVIIKFFGNDLISKFIFFIVLYPWTKIVMSSVQNVLIFYNKTISLVIYTVSHSILSLSAVIIAQKYDLDFVYYMLIIIIIEIVYTLIVYSLVKNITKDLTPYFNLSFLRNVLKYSIPIGLASILGTINIELDKLIISYYFNIEQLAIYTNAGKELPISFIAASITAVIMPELVKLFNKGNKVEAINLWKNSITLSYIIICLFAVGIFVFSPEVVTILYSEKYLSGITVFRVYTIILLFRFTYFGMALNALGKTRYILYSSIGSLLINFVLNFLFYNWFGFVGPAIASVISVVSIQFFQLLATSKILQISFKDIFPWKDLLFITMINILFGFLFYYLKIYFKLDIVVGEIWESLILGFIWSITYLVLINRKIRYLWNVLQV